MPLPTTPFSECSSASEIGTGVGAGCTTLHLLETRVGGKTGKLGGWNRQCSLSTPVELRLRNCDFSATHWSADAFGSGIR